MRFRCAATTSTDEIRFARIASANDALEFLIAGCRAVQVGTANFVDPLIWPKLLAGIEHYMERHELTILSELTGSLDTRARENEWISVESEFDLDTGLYSTYITTQDGVYNQSLHTQLNIAAGAYGAPAETVPSPYWWGSIDCSTGCFWGWPDDGGSYPRPADTYIWYSHFVMSNTRIGPPAGFVQ